MDTFNKRMASEVIEDAFSDLDSPYGRGVASGLCGAFYMCGLLSEEEWKSYLKRIPPGSGRAKGDGMFVDPRDSVTMQGERLLN